MAYPWRENAAGGGINDIGMASMKWQIIIEKLASIMAEKASAAQASSARLIGISRRVGVAAENEGVNRCGVSQAAALVAEKRKRQNRENGEGESIRKMACEISASAIGLAMAAKSVKNRRRELSEKH